MSDTNKGVPPTMPDMRASRGEEIEKDDGKNTGTDNSLSMEQSKAMEKQRKQGDDSSTATPGATSVVSSSHTSKGSNPRSLPERGSTITVSQRRARSDQRQKEGAVPAKNVASNNNNNNKPPPADVENPDAPPTGETMVEAEIAPDMDDAINKAVENALRDKVGNIVTATHVALENEEEQVEGDDDSDAVEPGNKKVLFGWIACCIAIIVAIVLAVVLTGGGSSDTTSASSNELKNANTPAPTNMVSQAPTGNPSVAPTTPAPSQGPSPSPTPFPWDSIQPVGGEMVCSGTFRTCLDGGSDIWGQIFCDLTESFWSCDISLCRNEDADLVSLEMELKLDNQLGGRTLTYTLRPSGEDPTAYELEGLYQTFGASSIGYAGIYNISSTSDDLGCFDTMSFSIPIGYLECFSSADLFNRFTDYSISGTVNKQGGGSDPIPSMIFSQCTT